MIQLELVENSVKPFLYTARLREDSNGRVFHLRCVATVIYKRKRSKLTKLLSLMTVNQLTLLNF
jgi:hypothetical protein